MVMLIKSLHLGLIGLFLFAASAWAGNSVFQGIVKDPKGQPVKGADVRIEAKNNNKVSKTVKTDANGRYTSDTLAPGTYRVALVVNGQAKASVGNAKITSGEPTQLNFELTLVSARQASAPVKKGRHMVWMPADTGTHLGGRWVEVDDSGNAASADGNRVQKLDATAVKGIQGRGNGGY
jgi:5-hydroxyisourate hydrolase-like protein (transthyretin family)